MIYFSKLFAIIACLILLEVPHGTLGESAPDVEKPKVSLRQTARSLGDELLSITLPLTICPKTPPVGDFDVARYISRSWFIQKQQVLPYQQANQLYCVVATYEQDPNNSEFLNVFNYANNDKVNGESQTSYGNFFSNLCAKKRREGYGELGVAPCFLRTLGVFDWVSGPYWVIAIDKANYEWAIISGGQPDVIKQTNPLKCTTKDYTVNGSGLWLFTREATGPKAQILTQAMIGILEVMGVYTGELKDVQQEGCNYEGAKIKA